MITSVFLTDGKGGNLFDATICEKEYGDLAEAAGIDMHLWQPDAIGVTTAKQMIEPLAEAVHKLYAIEDSPKRKQFASWVDKYLAACVKYKDEETVLVRTQALDAEEKAAFKRAEEAGKASR